MISCSVPYKKTYFPCGEMHITLDDPRVDHELVTVTWEFESSEELVELLLLVDALYNCAYYNTKLVMPYVPFSRQDRVNKRGECFSLQSFSTLINAMRFGTVEITDPHSDVTPALINRCCITHQHQVFFPEFIGKEGFWLISPDAGSLKKIHKLAQLTKTMGVVECSKYRDLRTGKILSTIVHHDNLCGFDCYIVDDICDGGRTFIEIAKKLKELNCGKIILMVTHGFFTQGLEVFDGLIDEIYTRKGRVK